MSAPVQSRQRIIDRIRVATESVANDPSLLAYAYAALPCTYILRGHLTAEGRIALMIERLHEYDAEVVESTPQALPTAIAAQLAASGKHAFVVPAGLPAEWLAPGFDWKIDRGLTNSDIELAEGVVTAAFCGVADSGTIVLHRLAPTHSSRQPGGGNAPRVLQLLPAAARAGHMDLRAQRNGRHRNDTHQRRPRTTLPPCDPRARRTLNSIPD